MAGISKAGRLAAWVLLAAAIPAPLVAGDRSQPTEAQCRQMVDGMVHAMRSAEGKMNERDRAGARAVGDKAEAIVRENRRKGSSECDSWRAIGKLATGS